jgi:TPR repeat protein
MYLHGEGIREDENAGFEWMRLAAASGYPPAIYCLGAFQKDAGLPVDGQVTEETNRRLNLTF